MIIEQNPGNDIKDYEDLQTGRSQQTGDFLVINMCDQLKCSSDTSYSLGSYTHVIHAGYPWCG